MIAKNIKGKGFSGCVRYVMNQTCELLEAEGVWADSAESIIRSFAMQRSMRSGVVRPVGHIPISVAPEDKPRMTNDFMLQLAKEYMAEMGITNTQYIIVRHHNTENDHLHIVYNRIDNDLKIIFVNNDYKRNVEICKKLKDKHDLTYGEGKERVKREKLSNPDKAKYKIYDAITQVLPHCKDVQNLIVLLKQSRIDTELKRCRTTDEAQGISFRYGNISFKGSQVDRKFSFANLKKVFLGNMEVERLQRSEQDEQADKQTQRKSKIPSVGGVELTAEQWDILKEGGFVFLENMTNSKGQQFSAYVFTDENQERVFMLKNRPDEFVKYGQYEMRAMDKRLVEAGHVTKAIVKWYDGRLARPYLWNPNAVNRETAELLKGYKLVENSEYCESWGDPRIEATKKPESTPHIAPKRLKKNRGRKL